MTFKFTVNLFLLNLLSKYLLGNSLSLSEASACLLPNSSSSVTPTISNTIEINGIRLQAEVEKYDDSLQNSESYTGVNYRSLPT